jgi:hypothetical protein
MKKILFLLVCFAMFLATCAPPKCGCFHEDVFMQFAYEDKSGNDLLDSTFQNHYVAKNICVYNLIDGIKEKLPINEPRIVKNSERNMFSLNVWLSDTTLIELDTNTVDTIVSKTENTSEYRRLSKVWYNAVLKWERNAYPFIIIEK